MSLQIFFVIAFLSGLLLMPLLLKSTRTVLSPYTKAKAQKRLAAATVDAMICASILILAFLQKSLFVTGVAAIFVITRDAIFEGQSPGKKVAGLRTIRLQDGKPCRLPQSIARNILLALPGVNLVAFGFELWLIFTDRQGMRLGDRLAKTQVVEGKEMPEVAKWFQIILDYLENFADQQQSQKEPAQIGKKVTN